MNRKNVKQFCAIALQDNKKGGEKEKRMTPFICIS